MIATAARRPIKCAACRRRADLVLTAERPKEPGARSELAKLRGELRRLIARVERQDVGLYGVETALRGLLEE